jgi:hypothetical protein
LGRHVSTFQVIKSVREGALKANSRGETWYLDLGSNRVPAARTCPRLWGYRNLWCILAPQTKNSQLGALTNARAQIRISSHQYKKPRKSKNLQGLETSGSSTWARTRDLRINSPALYQLSYRGIARDYSGLTWVYRLACSDTAKVRGAIGNRYEWPNWNGDSLQAFSLVMFSTPARHTSVPLPNGCS